MNKSKIYLKKFSAVLFGVMAIYFGCLTLNLVGIEIEKGLIAGGIVFILYALGAVFIAPGLNKEPEHFILRFLILTTVQMLAALSVILVLVFKQVDGAKIIGFHLISLFIILLFIQSLFLIRLSNRK